MTQAVPAGAGSAPRRGAPLIVTAELPGDILAWADELRRAHFPPERNVLRAHVTLFHALPPSAEDEVRRLLAELAAAPPPPARITGLMKLGGGTALAIDSPAMLDLRAHVADRMHGALSAQDAQKSRLHITIQNKVTGKEAQALQAQLAPTFQQRDFHFAGFGLHAYEGGPWRHLRDFAFRGRRGQRAG